MSDHMTTGEIEDVLSSIRRLVSEDEPVTSEKDDNADRLVLGPALRVEGDTTDASGAKGDKLEAELAELEASVSKKADQWGDDDEWEPVDPDTVRGPEAAPAQTIDADVVTFRPSAREGASPDAENVGSPDLDALLDENELRELVAEVLREELKGPLGERITRNVRKLVRREIAQALSSLDVD